MFPICFCKTIIIYVIHHINENDIHSKFRKFDGGLFTTDDDGDWEYSSVEEIDEEDFEEENCKCNWEDKYD